MKVMDRSNEKNTLYVFRLSHLWSRNIRHFPSYFTYSDFLSFDSIFWMRSSDYLYTRFIKSTYYQKYIQETIVEKRITPLGRVKLFTSLFLIFAIPCIIVRNPFMTTTLTIVYIAHLIGLNLYFNRKKDIL